MTNKIQKIVKRYQNMNKMAKATLWFFMASLIQQALSVLTTPIFSRLLTLEQYGQVTIFNSWMQIVSLLCTMGLGYGVFNKGMSKYGDDKDGYTLSMQSFTTIIALVFTIFYLVFRQPINELTELPTMLTLIMILEVTAKSAFSYWIIRSRYDYKYKQVVTLSILLSLLNVFVSLVTVFLVKEKGVARIISVASVQILIGLAIYILNLKRGKRLLNRDYVKFAFGFNLPLLPHYLSTYILNQSDRIMIQKIIGIEEAAVYGVAYSAAMVINIVSSSINNSLIPWQYRKLKEKDFKSLNKQINRFMLIFVLAAIAFIAFAPEAIYLLAGKKYYEAVYCIPPIAASCFFTFLFGLYGNAEFHYNANKFTMYISIIGAVLNLTLNYIFIKQFGYIAAAYTTLICYLLFTFAHFTFVNIVGKRNVGRKIFDSKVLIICTIILCGGSIFLSTIYEHWIIRYALIMVLSGLGLLKRKELIDMVKAK